MPSHHCRETPEEERRRLIFPVEWNLRELESVRAIQKPKGRKQMLESGPEPPGENLLYGDVWLLGKAAEASGLQEDLVTAFEGDDALANHLLAAAMFLAAGHGPLRQAQHWQRVRAMSIPFPQTLGDIEETSSFCNGWSIKEFYRLRAARLAGKACIAVESTVRAELDRPAGLRLAVGMEGSCERIPKVDVYAVEDGMPVFSQAFLRSDRFGADLAGDMLQAVAEAGLKDVPLVTTLGFGDVRRLARLVRQGAPLVMPTSLYQPHAARALKRLGANGQLREGMELEVSRRFGSLLWHRQFAIGDGYVVIDENSDKKCSLARCRTYAG